MIAFCEQVNDVPAKRARICSRPTVILIVNLARSLSAALEYPIASWHDAALANWTSQAGRQTGSPVQVDELIARPSRWPACVVVFSKTTLPATQCRLSLSLSLSLPAGNPLFRHTNQPASLPASHLRAPHPDRLGELSPSGSRI